ncbi:hypothetical protein PA598K_04815 [Paenibacillus sp. 598K]|uniref:DUF3696 domain-containing protein n=1 Tax=Paenibacillus sp. 598K TaxID=1117987 RepID=UPI000FF9BFF3|nr:DUF3696 domain-containing protein [Paenibacillus sp. 598K]GBF76352.1 hypothetical protein PA598K_04815 [Paenibacillus sp. 598K]
MISQLTIKGLKSIDNTDLAIKPLTLFVGMNSSGKSTAVQSILLAMQNITEEIGSPINGDLVSIGEFDEATNFRSNSKEIEIHLESENDASVRMKFYEDEQQMVKWKYEGQPSEEMIAYLHRKNKRIQYLSANRTGAQDTYSKNYSSNLNFGNLGEYTIHYFETHKKDIIHSSLIKDQELGSTLQIQVNYWMNHIIDAELTTEDIVRTDKVKAQFHMSGNRKVRPKNIGSGLSYLISIIVSILSSNEGDLLVIENPEIHLHPRAQSRLTELFAFAAQSGLKLIIESHSDHIFNGVRKAINKKTITSNDVSVYYFKIDNNYITTPTRIEFKANGNVVNHQKGLFDQFDDDLDELLGL